MSTHPQHWFFGIAIGMLAVWALGPPSSYALAPSSPSTDTSITVQRLLIRGMTETLLGDETEAITYFEAALDEAPQSPTLLGALADAHGAQGEYSTALFYARQARDFGENRPYHHRKLAELQRAADAPNDALQTYRSLLRQFPDNTSAYRSLAQLQAELGRSEAALETYSTLLDRQSHVSAETYRRMLELHRRVGNEEEVRTTLEALVDRRPQHRQYRRELAQHHRDHGRPEAAIDLLKSLVRERPGDRELRTQLQAVYRETGQTDAAAALEVETADVNVDAMSGDQLVERAESMFDNATTGTAVDTSLLRNAERLLQRALDQSEDTAEPLFLLAQIQEQWGDYHSAGQTYERALEENPRSPDRWAQAADAYLTAGRPTKAATVAEEGILLFPGNTSLLQAAAEAFLRDHHPDRALEMAQRAVDQSPERASSHHILGWVQLQRNQLDAAETHLQQALDLGQPSASLLEHYGDLHQALGNDSEARRYWQQALDRTPTDEALQQKLETNSGT